MRFPRYSLVWTQNAWTGERPSDDQNLAWCNFRATLLSTNKFVPCEKRSSCPQCSHTCTPRPSDPPSHLQLRGTDGEQQPRAHHIHSDQRSDDSGHRQRPARRLCLLRKWVLCSPGDGKALTPRDFRSGELVDGRFWHVGSCRAANLICGVAFPR
jgi:hypothetical protein